MKKIFVLTGEPSGDKLASTVINKLQRHDPFYLLVGQFQYQMIENNGFHANIRCRLAYDSQFWDTTPNRRTLMNLGPDPIII